jgi:hypothetical protein
VTGWISNWNYDGTEKVRVGQSVFLSSPIWGPRPDCLLLSNTLRVCRCETPSLTKERVCHLQLLLGLASRGILWSEYHGTHDHILLPQVQDSPKLEDQIPIFLFPVTGWPSYTPRQSFPFLPLIRLGRDTVELFEPASTWADVTESCLPVKFIFAGVFPVSLFLFFLHMQYQHLIRKLNVTDCFHSSPGIHVSEFYVILKQGDCDELPMLSKQARLCPWERAE